MDVPLEAEFEKTLVAIRDVIAGFESHRENLIPMLQAIQQKALFLPAEAMDWVGRHLDIPPADVYGVATFYNQFRFTPPGKHPIKICMGTACHVRGGDIILENFERQLDIREGETTEDREFSIERVACVGCCALAPVALVGNDVHGHMAPSKTEGLVLRCRIESEKAQREAAENDT